MRSGALDTFLFENILKIVARFYSSLYFFPFKIVSPSVFSCADTQETAKIFVKRVRSYDENRFSQQKKKREASDELFKSPRSEFGEPMRCALRTSRTNETILWIWIAAMTTISTGPGSHGCRIVTATVELVLRAYRCRAFAETQTCAPSRKETGHIRAVDRDRSRNAGSAPVRSSSTSNPGDPGIQERTIVAEEKHSPSHPDRVKFATWTSQTRIYRTTCGRVRNHTHVRSL